MVYGGLSNQWGECTVCWVCMGSIKSRSEECSQEDQREREREREGVSVAGWRAPRCVDKRGDGGIYTGSKGTEDLMKLREAKRPIMSWDREQTWQRRTNGILEETKVGGKVGVRRQEQRWGFGNRSSLCCSSVCLSSAM